jgi:hypothetical protein
MLVYSKSTYLQEEAPRQSLTEAQTAYLAQLQDRIIVAAGHTAESLPYESSMHKIVRQLNKESVLPNPNFPVMANPEFPLSSEPPQNT